MHDLLTVRYGHPSVSTEAFPHSPPQGFTEAMQAHSHTTRVRGLSPPASGPPPAVGGCVVRDGDGAGLAFDATEASLQKLAYHNPVATAELFHARAGILVKHVYGHDLDTKKSETVEKRKRCVDPHAPPASMVIR